MCQVLQANKSDTRKMPRNFAYTNGKFEPVCEKKRVLKPVWNRSQELMDQLKTAGSKGGKVIVKSQFVDPIISSSSIMQT